MSKAARSREAQRGKDWLCVQRAARGLRISGASGIRSWVEASLRGALRRRPRGVTVRLVGLAEGRRLNEGFRRQHGATNVLAFPAGGPSAELGDIVICVPVLFREAKSQGKAVSAHLAHLVVHGMLHLQGFDHKRSADARRMERCEVRILARIGISNPYTQ